MPNSKEYQAEYRKKNAAKIRENHRKAVEGKKAAGFCTVCGWGTPAKPGATLCEKHLLLRRQRREKNTETWQASGMCSSCGQFPAEEGKKSCERCLIYGCRGVRERGEEGKRKIVEYLGGKCEQCGLVTDCMPVYEIHHLTKKGKGFNVKTIRGWAWGTVLKELNKGVQLLCANCHRMIQHNHQENWANKTPPPGPRSNLV